MIPTDIGLPSKFTSFRKGQLEAACDIAASSKRFTIAAHPTGAGKSIIYVAVSRMLEARTMVLTANKGLQRQLGVDFGGIGMVDIRGQANYPCVMLQDRKGYHGCDEGPCHFGQECELNPRHPRPMAGCGFYDQLARIRRSTLCVTNYDFWMSANRYMEPGNLGKFDLLIMDEAHDAPDKLAEFCSVRINRDECDEFLETGLPPVEDGTEAWVNWAMKYREGLKLRVDQTKMFSPDDTDLIKRMSDLLGKLEFLATAHIWQPGEPSDPAVVIPGQANDWVGERTTDGDEAVFSPVWAHRYAEQYLFAGIRKVVMVSATILPRTAHYVGIPEAQLDYREHASEFAPDRRPIYLTSSASISKNSTIAELRAQSVKIDYILGRRLDRKGIIIAKSYDQAYQIRMGSQFKDRIIYHKRGAENVAAAVEQYRRAGPGTFLISAAIESGYDFPYEECEFQIIPKVPFPDTRSLVMKARIKSDKKYQNYLTVLSLVQRCGRGMRAVDDRCETFIVDDNIFWFNKAARDLIPKWFRAAYRRVDTLPEPPPRITRKL